MKLAKKGEPLDPEMLNPARKRDITEVLILECYNLHCEDFFISIVVEK